MYVRKCICIYVTKPHFKSSNMPYPLSLIASPISYLVSGIAITHTHPHTHIITRMCMRINTPTIHP